MSSANCAAAAIGRIIGVATSDAFPPEGERVSDHGTGTSHEQPAPALSLEACDFRALSRRLSTGLRTCRHDRRWPPNRHRFPFDLWTSTSAKMWLSFLLTAAGQPRILTGFPLNFPQEDRQQNQYTVCLTELSTINCGSVPVRQLVFKSSALAQMKTDRENPFCEKLLIWLIASRKKRSC